MLIRTKVLAMLTPALLIAGCSGTQNAGLDSVHQPVVTRNNYALDLTTAGYGLAPGEQARLAGWMSSMRVGYGDRVALDDPSGGGSVREQIAGEAARYGLLLADEAPITTGQVQPGIVRVVLTRSTASVPGCPDHSREYQPDFKQSTASNFGCAVNSNLAAMVANPEDLVRGQPGTGSADPTTAAKAITTYRATAPSGAGGLKSDATGGAK